MSGVSAYGRNVLSANVAIGLRKLRFCFVVSHLRMPVTGYRSCIFCFAALAAATAKMRV